MLWETIFYAHKSSRQNLDRENEKEHLFQDQLNQNSMPVDALVNLTGVICTRLKILSILQRRCRQKNKRFLEIHIKMRGSVILLYF